MFGSALELSEHSREVVLEGLAMWPWECVLRANTV
jgi:hypothetical protein